KGRYSTLLKAMRLSISSAATFRDFNYYAFSSGAGLEGFFEQLHTWLDALYRPDFTDAEAEREFYHFGVVADPVTRRKTLIEKGTVYAEMQARQGVYQYYFASNQLTLGPLNPLGFDSGGKVDEMRGVTPAAIRAFHHQHYQLGPTTGFIFAISPKERAIEFISRVASEFRSYSEPPLRPQPQSPKTSKYPIHSSDNKVPSIYRFPSANETDPGEILLTWPPAENTSAADLKLLEVFLRTLADGDRSLLYASLVDTKTRQIDSGATGVSSEVSLEDSPCFPVPRIQISGIRGNRISTESIEQLRNAVLDKVREISKFSDQSEGLLSFNKIVAAEAESERRSEMVWTKSPTFLGGSGVQTAWKDHLERLEMNRSFIQSLSEEPAWKAVDARLTSGRNIWYDLIRKFRLLETPYATASAPSRQLQDEIEKAKEDRIKQETNALMAHYHVSDEQEALSRFEQDELRKTKEIDEIGTRVPTPLFKNPPPLTLDDEIRYRQIRLVDVPVVASIFERPPTLDIGLSFDLSKIPRRYYRLLPLIPRCLDSL